MIKNLIKNWEVLPFFFFEYSSGFGIEIGLYSQNERYGTELSAWLLLYLKTHLGKCRNVSE